MKEQIIKNGKLQWEPKTLVYPVPAVMLSCGDSPENYNIITIAWTGTINSSPTMLYASIRKSRLSYEIVKRTEEFVINLTTKELAFQTDWCGVHSGRDYDKFKEMQLTPKKGEKVKAPLIVESPVNLECKVVEIKELGTHVMFIAEVVHIQADEKYLNPKTNVYELFKSNPLVYFNGHYYEMGEYIGKYGFAATKEKA